MRETWVWSDVALLLSDELLHFCSQPIPSSFTCPWSMFSFSSPQINLSLNLFPLKCQSPFTLQPITFPKLPSLLLFFFSQFMESLSTQSLKPKTLQLSLSPSLPYQVDHPGLWPVELYFRNILWIHFSAVSSLFWLRPRSSSWTIATITRHFFLPGIFHSAAQTSTPAPPCHHQDYLSEIWIQLGHSSAQTLTLHCL